MHIHLCTSDPVVFLTTPHERSRISRMGYLLPTTVESALAGLAAGGSTIVAGATDFYPALGRKDPAPDIVDISSVDELRAISNDANQWRIGALATWTDVMRANLPPAFAGLQNAARQVGGVQIQNVASVVGNLCNASPAADGVPPLLTLGARVEMQSHRGVREVPLDEFILGNRSTVCETDELVTAVLIPNPADRAVGAFEKLGARAYLVISIVMVAVTAEIDDAGLIVDARVAVGACSPVAKRLTRLEADLVGVSIDDVSTDSIAAAHLGDLTPVDDVRASAEYRMSVVPTLVVRALRACARSDQ